MTEAIVPLLSDEQIAVRDCEAPFVLVLASAGSGKTEVVAQRVELVLNSSSGFRVLALSYTRRAATELRERFEARIESHTRVDTDTIHGFAQGLLLQYGTWIGLPPEPVVVTDDADRIELLQSWRWAKGLPDLDEPKEALARMDLARARTTDDENAEDWAQALAESGAMDFEAMLTLAYELLQLVSGRSKREPVVPTRDCRRGPEPHSLAVSSDRATGRDRPRLCELHAGR